MRIICAALLAAAAGVGCVSSYSGTARSADPSLLEEPGWRAVRGVPVVLQETREDCGASALASVLGFYGDPAPVADNRTADGLRDEARRRGFEAYCVPATLKDLETEIADGHPAIVGLMKPQLTGPLAHYEVVVGLHPDGRVATIDPASGLAVNSAEGFMAEWEAAGRVAIIIAPKESRPRDASR